MVLGLTVSLPLGGTLGMKRVHEFADEAISPAHRLLTLTNSLSVETMQGRTDRFKSSRAVYPKPPLPTLPRAGGTFLDPTFGTEIMRTTDERDDKTGASTYYSHWPTFNCNNSRILVRTASGNALIKSFDPETFTIGASFRPDFLNVPGLGRVAVNFEGAIWHPTNPDLLYCFTGYRGGGMSLFTYNVVTRRYALVKDFSSLGGPDDYLLAMSMSSDGDTFAWSQMRVDSDYNPIYYIVWRKSSDRVIFHAPMNHIINKVRLDKSGQFLDLVYASIQPDKTAGAFLTLATRQVEILKWNSADSPPGHGDLGTGFIAGWDNWECGINVRSLKNVHAPKTVFRFTDARGVWDWTNGVHGTMLADNEDWITLGTFDDPSTSLPRTGVFKDEIFQVALDGSGRVRRICHTRSAIDQKTDTTGYWAMPKPTISRDGRFIAFTSNWEKSGRYDVFIARISPAPILTKSR